MNTRKKKGIALLVESAENQEENNDNFTVFIICLVCSISLTFLTFNSQKAGNVIMSHRKTLTLEETKGVKRKLKGDSRQLIDKVVFAWFAQQRAKQIPISGPMFREKARQSC